MRSSYFLRYRLVVCLLLGFIEPLTFVQAQGKATSNRLSEIGSSPKHIYQAYDQLVMAGYQGWFAADGDGSQRGWHHLGKKKCGFGPGCTCIDFWPDLSEYKQTYATPFQFADGTGARLYSAYDESTVNLHFKWMKDYGIDGVFMQRFVVEIKQAKGKVHFNKVLGSALKAAREYGRAICIMYDLSGCTGADLELVIKDWQELQTIFKLFDPAVNPTYLHHNQKPLLAIWGVGFEDGRKYSTDEVTRLVDKVKGMENPVSLLLGVPYYWRTMEQDTKASPAFHPLIKKADIIMPWAVGRYRSANYATIAENRLKADLNWCKQNSLTYVPLVFPGFSWGNLKNDTSLYNLIPRQKGDFFWQQVAGAKKAGAQSLYVAMFDEMDEGTAIFKCLPEDQLPLNGNKKFVGLEQGLKTDYYLWLTGEATRWFHGAAGYSSLKPSRK